MSTQTQDSAAFVLPLRATETPATDASAAGGSVPESVQPSVQAATALPVATSNTLEDQLKNAERLLFYASEAGIDIAADVREEILGAVAAHGASQSPASAAAFLAASTKLAAAVRPVTAASLRACENKDEINRTVHLYRLVAIWLAVIIIPISLITFVTS